MKNSFQFFTVLLLTAIAQPCVAEKAVEPIQDAVVTFKLDVSTEGRVIPAIFVKGELAGIAPGTIGIPLEKDGVAIEIGLPRLKQIPLYSFVLGPAEFKKQEADIVVTNINIKNPDRDNIWTGVFLKPNNHVKTKIIREDGGYVIHLPPEPYEKIGSFWRNQKIQPESAMWVSDIPRKNNQSAVAGYDHLTYNSTEHKVEYLTAMKEPYWSGAATVNLALRLPIPIVHYRILSQPPEATVITEEGPQGLTAIDLDLGKTRDSFIVLRKNGYLDTPSTKCKETKTEKNISLDCILKKRK